MVVSPAMLQDLISSFKHCEWALIALVDNLGLLVNMSLVANEIRYPGEGRSTLGARNRIWF